MGLVFAKIHCLFYDLVLLYMVILYNQSLYVVLEHYIIPFFPKMSILFY